MTSLPASPSRTHSTTEMQIAERPCRWRWGAPTCRAVISADGEPNLVLPWVEDAEGLSIEGGGEASELEPFVSLS